MLDLSLNLTELCDNIKFAILLILLISIEAKLLSIMRFLYTFILLACGMRLCNAMTSIEIVVELLG